MKPSPEIDLGRSLRQVFGGSDVFSHQIAHDCARQTETAHAILRQFFGVKTHERRELMILADEVGLGKTYVGLATAVSMLDAIRRGECPDGLPANKPVVMVLTPTNDALFNKWMREAEAFRKDCARHDGGLDWLQIRSPIENSSKSGNVVNLTQKIREATRSKPMLLIAKQSVFGAALHDRDLWRRRGLAALFRHLHTPPDIRRYWCRKGKVFDNFGIPELNELLDLRSSAPLWDDPISTDLAGAFSRALSSYPHVTDRLATALTGTDGRTLSRLLDDLARYALVSDWPQLSLVMIDEIHGLKNQVQSRRYFEAFAAGKVCRLLGLSATPFQLRHDELLSLLKLRCVLSLPSQRVVELDDAESQLRSAMEAARDAGEAFRRRWKALQITDQGGVAEAWNAIMATADSDRPALAGQICPPRVKHAIAAAMELERRNTSLRRHLRPIVIRHQHRRGYREHFVGEAAASSSSRGSSDFTWFPGIEIRGNDELPHYLMMRAVALAKEERGLPGLGAELTGSYRHLIETSAVWKKLATSSNPILRSYRAILDETIGKRTEEHDPDAEHRKVDATVRRALEFFKKGQKSLVFCVYTKTAEAVRDRLDAAIGSYLAEVRESVFGGALAFDNFRKRFFNRREALFSLIQDHPLLGAVGNDRVGVPASVALGSDQLEQVGRLLIEQGEYSDSDKPDRRLLLAATEHVAVRWWNGHSEGSKWLEKVLQNCPVLQERIAQPSWLEAREPLSRSERAGRARKTADPEARHQVQDPLDAEEDDVGKQTNQGKHTNEDAVAAWVRRLREDAIGEVVAPYFQPGLIAAIDGLQPILAMRHREILVKFDLETRAVAGQVFRRILMAEEFLLRYLATVEKDNTTRWAGYLSDRYIRPLDGHLESLRDRVNAYLETLDRARKNHALLAGYRAGAENRNVVQLVKGDTQNRDRYFLGFNTPYRPEILVSTSVGQEGIDLHRECRHVIHHDLCWNPATIEQRTGRTDRIGSKVERERMGVEQGEGPTLEIAVPYLAATYDERMFEELYRRAQLFEVTLGGDMRIEGRIDPNHADSEHRRRQKMGIGTDDEDLGDDGDEVGSVDLPADMIQRLRVDLSVWKRPD
ncbi:MAG: helicase-related protein [Phycisphaeraceae bacterium]